MFPKYKIKNSWTFNMSHPKLYGNSLDNNVRRNECFYSIQKEDCKKNVKGKGKALLLQAWTGLEGGVWYSSTLLWPWH
jgi:hypothetical protein